MTPTNIVPTLVDGEEVVRVELVGHKGVFATVDAASFAKLPEAARRGRWYLNRGYTGLSYVKFSDAGGTTQSVARALAKARRGEIVSFRNGDRLDLRRGNLRVTRRKTREPADMTPTGSMAPPEATSGLTFAL